MGTSPEKLLALAIPDSLQEYRGRDNILYALGIGVGLDQCEEELCFVYEETLRAFPTFAGVAAHPGFWVRDLDTGLDWTKAVHAESGLTLHRSLPISGRVKGSTRVVNIVDKGADRGALIYSVREITDADSGELLASIRETRFCRGDGGMGGSGCVQPQPYAIPARDHDLAYDLPTSPQSAMIYRLSGDYNPLHIDPKVAARAGFSRPILHGLATFGIAARAIIRSSCGHQPEKLHSIALRFTAPVLPGEVLRTEIWNEPDHIAFRVRIVGRGTVVADNGRATCRI